MPRHLVTQPLPKKPLDIPLDARVVAPRRLASDVLGRTASDLRTLAKDLLRSRGIGLATPIQSAEALGRAAEEVFGRKKAADSIRRYREPIGAMLRSGMDLDALERAASGRIRPTATLARRYSDVLRERDLIDTEASLAEAGKLRELPREKLFIYGYFRGRGHEARPEEFEFIDKIAADGSVFYLPCGAESFFDVNRRWIDILEKRGWEQVGSVHNVRSNVAAALALRFAGTTIDVVTTDNVEAVSYANIESEVRGTLGGVKATARAGTPLERIAAVCRDMPLYAPLIVSTAREYGLPIELDHNVPIGETALGEFVALLLDVIKLDKPASGTGSAVAAGTFLYEPTLRLLCHRFGPGMSEDELISARRTHPSCFEAWHAITTKVDGLKTDGERDRAGWARWLRGIADGWNVRDKTARESRDLSAYNAFFDSIDELARNCYEKLGGAAFAGDIVDVLTDIKTPFDTGIGGIRILQPNAAVGCEFEKLFIIGMAEGILPQPATDDSVLDLFERRVLAGKGVHFEDALEVPRWEALSFYFTLLSCTGDLVLSYPRYAAGSELLPSSYFDRIGLKPTRPAKRFVSSPGEYRELHLLERTEAGGDEILASARRRFEIETRRESSAPPDEYDGVTGIRVKRRKWSASSLTRLGSCPFKWFASDILKLTATEEADADLRADVRGRLYHKTLELAVERSRSSHELSSAIIEVLEEEFANAESEHEMLAFIANWELRRDEHIERLRFAIMSDHFIDAGATVHATEQDFEADFAGMKIVGKLDRIDRLTDGSLFAVDYKSGKFVAKIKDENGDLRIDLQLPIYTKVALPHLFPGATVSGGTFLSISDGKRVAGGDPDLEAVLARLRRHVEQGEFAVDPDVRQDACKHCDFDIVCRRGPRLSRKRSSG